MELDDVVDTVEEAKDRYNTVGSVVMENRGESLALQRGEDVNVGDVFEADQISDDLP